MWFFAPPPPAADSAEGKVASRSAVIYHWWKSKVLTSWFPGFVRWWCPDKVAFGSCRIKWSRWYQDKREKTDGWISRWVPLVFSPLFFKLETILQKKPDWFLNEKTEFITAKYSKYGKSMAQYNYDLPMAKLNPKKPYTPSSCCVSMRAFVRA